MPLGLMTSNAPVMLVTNWMTLLKLSSPILQEPSIRKTRSALAPLHTAAETREPLAQVSWQLTDGREFQLSLPSRAGGTVAGGGGVGGSVGSSVGLTTAKCKNRGVSWDDMAAAVECGRVVAHVSSPSRPLRVLPCWGSGCTR